MAQEVKNDIKKALQVNTIPLIAIMTAVTTVLTMLVKIPTPIRGYLNLSDTMIYFSAYAFGPWVGGIIGGIIVCRMYKLDAWTLADLAVIGAPLALCLGRCANFVNGELWGKPTNLPWGVVFGGTAGDMPRHPSQLYEAFLEGIVLFCILQVLSRKKPLLPQGTFMGVFVMGYGIVRFLIEFVRVPDAQLGYLLGGVITMGQLLSLPLVIAGLALIIFALRRDRPQRIYLDV